MERKRERKRKRVEKRKKKRGVRISREERERRGGVMKIFEVARREKTEKTVDIFVCGPLKEPHGKIDFCMRLLK
jgi:hypothetical protein